jgi:hypothetical protein
MSNFHFIGPIQLQKNTENIYIRIFIKKKIGIYLLGCIDFEILMISRIFYILMFIITTFIKSFRVVMLFPFFEIFGHEHMFEDFYLEINF